MLEALRTMDIHHVLVVGAGPAGLSVVGNLLEKNGQCRIVWVDPHFQGGRISSNYHEISSNTKVARIVDFARAVVPYKKIIDNAPCPNAITALESHNQNEGCTLVHAANMFSMLTAGLVEMANIEAVTGVVSDAHFNTKSSSWCTRIQSGNENTSREVYSRSLVLCSGSSPSAFTMDLPGFSYHKVDLDTALSPSCLEACLCPTQEITVGVIGSSHSAVTVLMNLTQLAKSSHQNLRVKWFSRRPLIYAVYMDGWILYDNTGLKGIAADFARENLEPDKLPGSPVGRVIERIDCSLNSEQPYEKHLPQCTHIIQAVGFVRDPLPQLSRDGAALEDITYDHQTGGFKDKTGEYVDGLYGAGIAFPEIVTDPAGNAELAVGFWKFMQYVKRIVPTWHVQ